MDLKRRHSPAYLSHHIHCNVKQIFLIHKLAYGHKFYAGFYGWWSLTHILREQDSVYPTELPTHLSFLFTQYWEIIMLNNVLYSIPGPFVVLFCVVPHKSRQIKLSDIYKYKILNFLEVLFSLSYFILIYLDSKRFNSSLHFSFLST